MRGTEYGTRFPGDPGVQRHEWRAKIVADMQITIQYMSGLLNVLRSLESYGVTEVAGPREASTQAAVSNHFLVHLEYSQIDSAISKV